MQVLSGMGGVGKTSLARAYAQRHLNDYGIVWWVRSEDPNAIDAEYRALLEILLPPGEATKVANARTVAFALLAKQEEPWLLVLDNVPDPDVVLPPTGNGHVLITSRATGWPDPTTVLPLGEVSAVKLLTSRSGDNDKESAKALAAELAGLPLALTQAAGFVRTKAVDLTTYHRLYRERSAELHEEGRPADYPHTVATTWQLAIDRLTELARDMLNVLAFYAPDAIPVHLLFADIDELIRHRAIGELCAYSLITPAGPDTVSVHRLVQAVTRDPAWVDKAHKRITAAIPIRPVTATSLTTWNALHTHVFAVLDHLPPESLDTLSTRDTLAAWIGRAGDAPQARDLFAALLPIRERVQGAEHPVTLITRYYLAYWTGEAGDSARARDLFAALLPIHERVQGADHTHTLITRQQLARRTGDAGDPTGARALFAQMLPLHRKKLGAEHPETLTAQHNLAYWTAEMGDIVAARDMLAELLPIRERVSGAEHPYSLAVRGLLARLAGKAGDAAVARDMYADLLPIRERVLGAEHPDTLVTRHNSAHWTGEAGDAAKARKLYAELLPIQERVSGAEHPDTVAVRRALARWTALTREVEEAGPGGGGEG